MTEKNEKLIQELRREMESELEKGAEKMDTYKIRDIVQLLERLEQWEPFPEDMEKERFFEEFDKKYGMDLSEARAAANGIKKVKQSAWKWKITTVVAVLVLAVGVCNAVTVSAVDKSLWQLVRENSHMAYFHVIGKNDGIDKEEESLNAQYEQYDNWDALKKSVEKSVLSPEYIPEGLMLEKLEKMTLEGYMAVMAYYRGENSYLSFSFKYYKEVGTYGNSTVGNEPVGEYITIDGREIQIRESEEFNLSFTDNDIFYSINTDMEIEEVEKFIEGLK